MAELRPSQIETLKAVARFELHPARRPGAPPARIAHWLGRKRDSVEESLAKLEEGNYVRAIFYPLTSAAYELTDKSRSALQEAENG